MQPSIHVERSFYISSSMYGDRVSTQQRQVESFFDKSVAARHGEKSATCIFMATCRHDQGAGYRSVDTSKRRVVIPMRRHAEYCNVSPIL